MEYQNKCLKLLSIFLLHFTLFVAKSTEAYLANQTIESSLKPSRTASAIFVFGDSTVDPGNNDYIPTLFRSNFLPYGRDFAGNRPTGRFSNGRLTTDFVASYMGLKDNVPPYLDPRLTTEDLMTGVSFASAGSGYDPLTPQLSRVIPVLKQIEYFKEYKKRIESKMGKQKTEEHIKKAVFVVSAGTNDFVINYFTLPIRRKTFSISTYQQFVLQHAKQFLQGLWDEGARKMVVIGLPPLGCLPMMITLNSPKTTTQRSCLDKYSSVAKEYNTILQNELNSMQNTLSTNSATRISYIDIYEPAMQLIQGHRNFGFDEISSGCCGTGYLEASFLCNPLTYACPDASKYMFWDSIHPTEAAYYYVFKTLCPIIDRILQG